MSTLVPEAGIYTVKIPKRLNTSVKHIGVFRAFVACLTSEYQLNTSLILLLNSKHNLNTYFNVCYNTMPILNTMQLRIKQAYVEGTFRPIPFISWTTFTETKGYHCDHFGGIVAGDEVVIKTTTGDIRLSQWRTFRTWYIQFILDQIHTCIHVNGHPYRPNYELLTLFIISVINSSISLSVLWYRNSCRPIPLHLKTTIIFMDFSTLRTAVSSSTLVFRFVYGHLY